jgi:hypothetical protein
MSRAGFEPLPGYSTVRVIDFSVGPKAQNDQSAPVA